MNAIDQGSSVIKFKLTTNTAQTVIMSSVMEKKKMFLVCNIYMNPSLFING